METPRTPEELAALLHSNTPEANEFRNKLGKCPTCDHNIADNQVSLYEELLDDVRKVYEWCLEKGKHEFDLKEIRHLLTTNSYTRFGNLKILGDILYPAKDPEIEKPRNGYYGINLTRAKEFFAGQRAITIWRTTNPITREVTGEKTATVKYFSKLKDHLTETGQYDARYTPPTPETKPVPQHPEIEDMGPGKYKVAGSHGKTYEVELVQGFLRCNCESFKYSGRKNECKHTQLVSRLAKERLKAELQNHQPTIF